MAYTVREASRENAKPLIGLYGLSNSGKTYGALLIARGFTGPTGRIIMIETEAGRGEAYANPVEYPEFAGPNPKSNYDVIPMRENFSPKAYGEALTAAETAGCDALIIDSASHEWEGRNGVLDMAAEREEKGVQGALIWQRPKLDHNTHFVLRFTQTPIPLVILCMRAKFPMMRRKKSNGPGFEWVRSETLEPIQSDGILSEMFIQGWITPDDHLFNPGKISARKLAPIFEAGKMLTLDTGRLLKQWAEEGGEAATEAEVSGGTDTPDKPGAPAAIQHSQPDRLFEGDESPGAKYGRGLADVMKNQDNLKALRIVWKNAQHQLKALNEDQLQTIVAIKDECVVKLTRKGKSR